MILKMKLENIKILNDTHCGKNQPDMVKIKLIVTHGEIEVDTGVAVNLLTQTT